MINTLRTGEREKSACMPSHENKTSMFSHQQSVSEAKGECVTAERVEEFVSRHYKQCSLILRNFLLLKILIAQKVYYSS